MAVHGLSKFLSASEDVRALSDALKRGPGKTVLCGATLSSKNAVIAAIANLISLPALVISNNVREAERTYRDLRQLLPEESVDLFPAWDTLPYEEPHPSTDIIGERLEVLWKLSEGKPILVVSTIKALISQAMPRNALRSSTIKLTKGIQVDISSLTKKLVSIGYERVNIVGERGEFAVRGGILDIYPSTGLTPARIDLLGDEIEAIKHFDVRSQRSIHGTEELTILPAGEEPAYDGRPNLLDHFREDAVVFIDDTYGEFEEKIKGRPVLNISSLSYAEEGNNVFKIDFAQPLSFISSREAAIAEVKNARTCLVVSKQPHRVVEVLAEEGIAAAYSKDIEVLPEGAKVATEGELFEGFKSEQLRLLVLTDAEIFGERFEAKEQKAAPAKGIDSALLVELKPGDYVVHENYGIGIYGGLERLTMEGNEQEYMLIRYEGEDKLYVPLSQMGLISKYSSSGDYAPRVNRLGGSEWARTKKKAMKSIEDLTADLLDIYASREVMKGYSYPEDSQWQGELEAAFPYEETPGQKKAIAEVKRDMESSRPMDRLVCGDVGYGKTEVALRAAFKAASAGKQVALLVPTTILAEQHFNNFRERFKPFPLTVEMLSRFRTRDEQKEIIEKVAVGEIDVVIGTHRLLQKDIKFLDLGLLIIDEEQKFGVAHKEKLKKLKRTVDVLSLSATPIPRTLYLSLSGARDLSMISTPPVDRSPVKTFVLEWSRQVIREAILRELERGGQVYYIYNHVRDIEKVGDLIRDLLPAAKVAVAHGQMEAKHLERTMVDFLSRQYDILVCTTIIESGIDLPNVNTIMIDHAAHFGLAQLYQLRGRVGRSSANAYAYLFFRHEDLSAGDSIERLQAIREFTALGSGYKLALRDLEIRGSGNLLGREQHGHMLAMGFDLYCDLMEKAVERAKGAVEVSPKEILIDIRIDAFIPPDYVNDERQRIAYYRRMNLLILPKEIEDMGDEMKDRFGELPDALRRLFEMVGIKVAAKGAGIKKIDERDGVFYAEFFDPAKAKGKKSMPIGPSSASAKVKMLRKFIDGLAAS